MFCEKKLSSEKKFSSKKKWTSEKRLSCEKSYREKVLQKFVMIKERSYLVIEANEVRTVTEVMACDALSVAIFFM